MERVDSSFLSVFRIVVFAILVVMGFWAISIFLPTPLARAGIFIPSSSLDRQIFFSLRVPRILLGFLVGGSLALCGVILQAVFRNPLAGPFTLGIASGASFGASATIILFGAAASGIVTAGSLLGSVIPIVCIALVAFFSSLSGGAVLLLAGLMMSFFFSSLVLLMQALADPSGLYLLNRWLMGTITTVGYSKVSIVAIVSALGLGGAYWMRHSLDLLSLGDEFAFARGVPQYRAIGGLILCVSAVTATVVSQVGPIGFVGILVPHVARALGSSAHGKLVPNAFFLGGVFLVVCDTVSQALFYPAGLPVGVCTAILGTPLFLWLFLRDENLRIR